MKYECSGGAGHTPERDTEGAAPVHPQHTTPSTLDDKDRALLERFPAPRRSLIANLFLAPVRRGAVAPALVVRDVLSELDDRLGWALRNGGAYAEEERAKVRDIMDAVINHGDEAEAYARWCVAYEALPEEERRRRKAGRTNQAVAAWMDRQEPTEKQVAYLRRRGYAGPIDSRAHASSLIDVYTRGGRVETGGAS
jgi:hypothetical protein